MGGVCRSAWQFLKREWIKVLEIWEFPFIEKYMWKKNIYAELYEWKKCRLFVNQFYKRYKFRFSKKATKIWQKICLLICCQLSKIQTNREISSNFVAFLEDLKFIYLPNEYINHVTIVRVFQNSLQTFIQICLCDFLWFFSILVLASFKINQFTIVSFLKFFCDKGIPIYYARTFSGLKPIRVKKILC